MDTLHSPNWAKGARPKIRFFLNGVNVRALATPLSANMMPSFRESHCGLKEFEYPRKQNKNIKTMKNAESSKTAPHVAVLSILGWKMGQKSMANTMGIVK